MDDNRQFLYALTAGTAISGLLFWLAFWHGRILLAIFLGLTLSLMSWFRYGGAGEWDRLQHHGTHRQIRRYQATVLLLVLTVVALCVILEIKGALPK